MLKKYFDLYQEKFIPDTMRIKSTYFKLSRRAITNLTKELYRNPIVDDISISDFLLSIGISHDEFFSILKNNHFNMEYKIINFKYSEEYKKILNSDMTTYYDIKQNENQRAFKKYLVDNFDFSQAKLAIVDVGWKGRMQSGIYEISGKPISGYYIGIIDSLYSDTEDFHLKGLILSNYVQESDYFHLLRVNTQLYEQLLAAPHGSAISYQLDANNNIIINEVWDENEKELYLKEIKYFQRKSLEIFQNLCNNILTCRNQQIEDKLLAKMVIKESLFTTKNSRGFLKKLDSGFVWNFTNTSKGLDYQNIPRIKYKEFFLHPEIYARYVVKLERFLEKRKIRFLYPCFAYCYYFYLYLRRKV